MWRYIGHKGWLLIFVFFALGAMALSWNRIVSAEQKAADNEKQVALGRTLYMENCAACHGENLEGQPNWQVRKADNRLPAPPHDETGHTWHHPDNVLFKITKVGLEPPLAPEGYESDMPAFGETLTDKEIWAVLAFIKKSWPLRHRSHQKKLSEKTPQ